MTLSEENDYTHPQLKWEEEMFLNFYHHTEVCQRFWRTLSIFNVLFTLHGSRLLQYIAS